ncbi:MAG: hypothetical protein U0I48_01220 [Acutalibacteraceae bacterium]|nr:hypothetical protein [Acutalibacteraceae bacterium]
MGAHAEGIKCPYFISEGRKSITCEGLTENVNWRQVFPDERVKRAHTKNFCRTYLFGDCPAAKELSKKYK